MGESFVEYSKAVTKKWWWLVGTMIGGIMTIAGILNVPIPFSIPIGLVIFFFCLFIAQFLAYHDLRKNNQKLVGDLRESKIFESKSQRIDIISKEKYPSEVLRIFDDMRRCLSDIVESADNIPGVTFELMTKCIHGDPHELYLAIHQKSLDDNVNVTFSFYRQFNYGIGLSDQQKINNRWKQLVENLETIKKNIPDQELINYIIAHYTALNGVHAIRLFYRFMAKYGTHHIILQAVEPFRPVPNLLDQTMARVTNRILELKLGEEPKWEMLYFKER